ncbi:MAG: hypothetical protein ACOC8Y_03020 [Candidatus Natronoplasma sp.]
MERLKDKKKDEHGVLSMIDAALFGITILVVMLLVFQQFGGAMTRERDLESSEFRREKVHDIQKVALYSVIEETGYVNLSESEPKPVRLVNITLERAVKDYLYLDHVSQNEETLSYDLSELESDIEEIYRICAWDVSRYNFALESSYETSELFLSNVQDIDTEEDLPSERAASTEYIFLGTTRVNLTLYVWR